MLTKHKNLVLLYSFFLCAGKLCAQETSTKGWYGILQQGVVFNRSEVKIQPGMAAGYEWKGYGLGLSGSIDFITVQSIQAAIDLRKKLPLHQQIVELYVSPGLNHVVATKQQKVDNLYRTDHQFKDGYYLEAGAGIFIGAKKNWQAGLYWSRKTYKESYSNVIWNPVLQKVEASNASTKYELNRLGIKVGFRF